ncbi:hypothetical protein Dsin_026432 [Dipteronia sinensis]|uniref:Lactate/malate dehydrogenase C-terminal domain-containing protein n=1 Tax=Dipteronia sinensis TaxID=43782 RepID=A0AAE0DXV3_9ROSI|nr:hypothetical protein Dsin_026432 [Dipteronia sinensis]
MAKNPVRVLVTGDAAKCLGFEKWITSTLYCFKKSLFFCFVFILSWGAMLGPDQPVILHMLDIESAADALNGVKMELIDAAFPLLKGVVATTDVAEACKDINIAVMVGGFPCKEALEKHAAPDCKVLVVANPANTNALILKEFAPSIPEKSITCLTRLDHNRALSQISERLDVHVSDLKNVIIWGNHSSTQYPDVNCVTVTTSSGKKFVRKILTDDNWLNSEFITTAQQRGEAIIKARKLIKCLVCCKGHGFRWECILMAPMESKKALSTLFQLLARKENGQSFKIVENDKLRNGNREALTALRKRARTTKTSVSTPFESLMKDMGRPGSSPLVKEVCATCGNHDSNEQTWMMFPGTDVFARIPFHAAHTVLETDQTRLDYESKTLQSLVKEKSLIISEKGALADKITPGVLRSLVTLTDKPK